MYREPSKSHFVFCVPFVVLCAVLVVHFALQVLIKKSREQHMDERLATLETEVLGITGQLEKLTALMVGIDAKLGGSTSKTSVPKITDGPTSA